MPEPVLNCTCIVRSLGQGIATAVAEHMSVDSRQSSSHPDALEVPVDCIGRKRPAALTTGYSGNNKPPAHRTPVPRPAGAQNAN
jgi:hypothetical protein